MVKLILTVILMSFCTIAMGQVADSEIRKVLVEKAGRVESLQRLLDILSNDRSIAADQDLGKCCLRLILATQIPL